MNAAEDDDVGVSFCRFLREAERIAHEIRDVLNFRHLIIVRENDGVELLFQRMNFLREGRGFGRGHALAQAQAVDGKWLDGRVNHGKSIVLEEGGVNATSLCKSSKSQASKVQGNTKLQFPIGSL